MCSVRNVLIPVLSLFTTCAGCYLAGLSGVERYVIVGSYYIWADSKQKINEAKCKCPNIEFPGFTRLVAVVVFSVPVCENDLH